MTLRFRSKVDAQLVVPVAVGVVIPVLLGIRGVTSGRLSIVAAVALTVVSLALTSFCFVSYTVTDDSIVVRRGVIRSEMPLNRPRELRGTREGMAAPALSLDRIEIRTDRGLWLLVSPSNRSGFVEAIRARVPAIKADGL